MAKRRIIELNKFSELTNISLSKKIRHKSQGTPRPKRISNILEPTALLIAIPPRPSLATIIDDRSSGTEVPTAKTVRAMITEGIFKISAIETALSTKTQLSRAIIVIEMLKTI